MPCQESVMKVNISIIIPTRNREALLVRCLEKLVKQVGKNDEVLVVDNNSHDDTKKVILDFQKRLPLRYLFESRRGSSFARNLGARMVKGETLVFLDGDCLVDSGWLEEIRKFSREMDSAVQGRIIHQFKKENIFVDVFWFYSGLCEGRLGREKKEEGNFLSVNSLVVGNLIVKKRFLKKINYWFDEKLFPYVGEQEDLSIRLQRAGIELREAPKVRVVHIKSPKTIFNHIVIFIYRSFFYGRTEGIIRAKYQITKKTEIVFKEEIRQLQQKKNKKSRETFFLKLKSFLSGKKIIYKIDFLFLIILREVLFSLGIIYGVINYKIFSFLSKRA